MRPAAKLARWTSAEFPVTIPAITPIARNYTFTGEGHIFPHLHFVSGFELPMLGAIYKHLTSAQPFNGAARSLRLAHSPPYRSRQNDRTPAPIPEQECSALGSKKNGLAFPDLWSQPERTKQWSFPASATTNNNETACKSGRSLGGTTLNMHKGDRHE